MNKEKLIAGLNMVIEALSEDSEVATTSKDTASEKVTPAEPIIGTFNEAELKAMKYNDFKKLASKLGVKCTGTREEIMKRILALDTIDPKDLDDAEEEPVVDEPKKPAKKTKKTEKKPEPVEEEEEDSEEDEFDVMAKEIAEDTPIKDIISALKDVDIKATKSNAVEKLAEALREGLIELDDEDEEESEELEEDLDLEGLDEAVEDSDVDEVEAEEVEITEDSYFEQFDPQGYNDPDEMTEERAEAIRNKMATIISDIEDEDLTIDDIASYIEDNASEEEIDILGEDYTDDELLMLYMELVKRTIDNDGEEHEPSDPYEIGEFNFCCGHHLQYSKKTNRYICSQCGTEYEAE